MLTINGITYDTEEGSNTREIKIPAVSINAAADYLIQIGRPSSFSLNGEDVSDVVMTQATIVKNYDTGVTQLRLRFRMRTATELAAAQIAEAEQKVRDVQEQIESIKDTAAELVSSAVSEDKIDKYKSLLHDKDYYISRGLTIPKGTFFTSGEEILKATADIGLDGNGTDEEEKDAGILDKIGNLAERLTKKVKAS